MFNVQRNLNSAQFRLIHLLAARQADTWAAIWTT